MASGIYACQVANDQTELEVEKILMESAPGYLFGVKSQRIKQFLSIWRAPHRLLCRWTSQTCWCRICARAFGLLVVQSSMEAPYFSMCEVWRESVEILK